MLTKSVCSDVDIQAQFSLNQSRAEEITMREDYGTMALAGPSQPGGENLGVDDEGFGDMLSFDRNETGPTDLLRDASAADQVNFVTAIIETFLTENLIFRATYYSVITTSLITERNEAVPGRLHQTHPNPWTSIFPSVTMALVAT
jgi:hypothetical protein